MKECNFSHDLKLLGSYFLVIYWNDLRIYEMNSRSMINNNTNNNLLKFVMSFKRYTVQHAYNQKSMCAKMLYTNNNIVQQKLKPIVNAAIQVREAHLSVYANEKKQDYYYVMKYVIASKQEDDQLQISSWRNESYAKSVEYEGTVTIMIVSKQ